MKDQLEQFFESHRDDFDVHEPPGNLWTGVDKKLRPAGSRLFWAPYAVAASVAVLVGMCLWTMRQGAPKSTADDTVQVVVNPEIGEALTYYASVVENRRSELRPFGPDYPALFKDFSAELDTLHVLYNQLMVEYRATDGNEAVSQALIENLQMQVQLLGKQLQIIQNIRHRDAKTAAQPKLL